MRTEFRGTGSLYWVTTIANKSAPTAAEISAGVKLHPQLTNDGLKTPKTGNTIDAADASDLFNKTIGGSYGGDTGEVTCYRDTASASDTAYTTLVDGATGFLVVARAGFGQDGTTGKGSPDGTPTAGDRCEVWPAQVITQAPVDIADGTVTRFSASISFPDSPDIHAVVA